MLRSLRRRIPSSPRRTPRSTPSKGKVLDTKALDAAVQARGDLIAKAKAIAPTVATDGKSDAEIRVCGRRAKLGDAAIAGKPAAYIDARFDILAEDLKPRDPVRGALRETASCRPVMRATIDQAASGMVTHLQDAWKNKGAA